MRRAWDEERMEGRADGLTRVAGNMDSQKYEEKRGKVE